MLQAFPVRDGGGTIRPLLRFWEAYSNGGDASVIAFTTNQWLFVGLIFLLGIVIGAVLRGGGRWKAAYYEEVRRRETLEEENRRLSKDSAEMDSLRHAAARDEARRRAAAEEGPTV
jgi:hypothetical protein